MLYYPLCPTALIFTLAYDVLWVMCVVYWHSFIKMKSRCKQNIYLDFFCSCFPNACSHFLFTHASLHLFSYELWGNRPGRVWAKWFALIKAENYCITKVSQIYKMHTSSCKHQNSLTDKHQSHLRYSLLEIGHIVSYIDNGILRNYSLCPISFFYLFISWNLSHFIHIWHFSIFAFTNKQIVS